MRAFLGLVNFCRRWIPDVALYTKLLSPLVSGNAPREFALTLTQEEAFAKLKAALAAATACSMTDFPAVMSLLFKVVFGACVCLKEMNHSRAKAGEWS